MTVPNIPPEWSEQSALWVGWPHLRHEWGEAFDDARAEIAVFARAAAGYVSVMVACGSDDAETSAKAALADVPGVAFARIRAGDIWLRDTGPIIDSAGTAHCFAFNGWGGKYVMPGDTETASAMADMLNLPERRHDFILEGGAIDVDGAGRLLTTRECLLAANRNGWGDADAEAALKKALGIEQVIWLERGLIDDHTDGHVDNIARFIAPGHVLCQCPSGEDDPNAALYAEIRQVLQAAGLSVSTIPSPGRITDIAGHIMPASHMNFVMTNGALFLPVYENAYSVEAVSALEGLMPERNIIPLSARHILTGGGSFHCMTREVPAFDD